MQPKYSFSGHETFNCRHYWLKKGVDFIQYGHKFSDKDSILFLGVGKNMVTSIHYWMKAFGLINEENKLNELATNIFSNDGWDPFLEDIGTLWLLHYKLISTNKASIYQLFFNEFIDGESEFTKNQLIEFIEAKSDLYEFQYSTKTISNDVKVFLKNYILSREANEHLEDSLSGLLQDLRIIELLNYENSNINKNDYYKVEYKNRIDLPLEILLFVILDNALYGDSISFDELFFSKDSPGRVFLIDRISLIECIQGLNKTYPYINFSDNAGIQELQFKAKPDKWSILKDYYGK